MKHEQIRRFSKNDPSAKTFLTWLKDQPNSIKTLGVSKAEDATKLDYYELVAIFKELEKVGAGTFIVGRKGHDSRIVWKYDTRSIGKGAIKGLSEFDMALGRGYQKVPEDAIDLLGPQKSENKPGATKHSFNLRKNFQIDLELPDDVTEHELKRLKSWLDLLVY